MIRHRPAAWLGAPLALLCLSTAWGGDPGFWPSGARWRQALRQAVRDPDTWVPAAAAVALGASGYDSKISNWAVSETPLFGSTDQALRASDSLRTASHLGMLATTLLTPGQPTSWNERAERLLFEHAVATASTSTAHVLKGATSRRRPDGSDRMSFPSGHATRAFVYVGLATRNLEAGDLSPGLERGLGIGLKTLAAGTAWARVEAGVHYPSDVLAGASLGNFVARLVNDAFLGRGENLRLGMDLSPEAPQVWLQWQF